MRGACMNPLYSVGKAAHTSASGSSRCGGDDSSLVGRVAARDDLQGASRSMRQLVHVYPCSIARMAGTSPYGRHGHTCGGGPHACRHMHAAVTPCACAFATSATSSAAAMAQRKARVLCLHGFLVRGHRLPRPPTPCPPTHGCHCPFFLFASLRRVQQSADIFRSRTGSLRRLLKPYADVGTW